MKLFIRQAAQQDILRQGEWYAERGLHGIARRFKSATLEAFGALLVAPNAGARRAMRHDKLAGLRVWPVKGFEEFRIFYAPDGETLTVLRVLHGKRDIGAILDDEE